MTTNPHGWSSSTNDHGATCPTCGWDIDKLLFRAYTLEQVIIRMKRERETEAALLREIERLRLRLRTLERYAVDPMPATGTDASVIEIRP